MCFDWNYFHYHWKPRKQSLFVCNLHCLGILVSGRKSCFNIIQVTWWFPLTFFNILLYWLDTGKQERLFSGDGSKGTLCIFICQNDENLFSFAKDRTAIAKGLLNLMRYVKAKRYILWSLMMKVWHQWLGSFKSILKKKIKNKRKQTKIIILKMPYEWEIKKNSTNSGMIFDYTDHIVYIHCINIEKHPS